MSSDIVSDSTARPKMRPMSTNEGDKTRCDNSTWMANKAPIPNWPYNDIFYKTFYRYTSAVEETAVNGRKLLRVPQKSKVTISIINKFSNGSLAYDSVLLKHR
jgi:hypothetical protein